MRQFRRERDVVTTQLATETNRLIIRVERVSSMAGHLVDCLYQGTNISTNYPCPSQIKFPISNLILSHLIMYTAVQSSASHSTENTKGQERCVHSLCMYGM